MLKIFYLFFFVKNLATQIEDVCRNYILNMSPIPMIYWTDFKSFRSMCTSEISEIYRQLCDQIFCLLHINLIFKSRFINIGLPSNDYTAMLKQNLQQWTLRPLPCSVLSMEQFLLVRLHITQHGRIY